MTASEGKAKIDAYIAKAQPFAVPVMETLREQVLAHCPDAEQTLKWGMPHFLYRGKILCNMASFKAHATFGFHHGAMVTGGTDGRMEAMGDLGKIGSVGDLPDAKTIAGWIAKARQLIDNDVKPPHLEGRGKHTKPEITMVPAFQAALDANAKAKAAYGNFAPSAAREYLEWIADAKREETRDKRITQAIIWISEGKKRNWKYESC